MTTYEIYSDTSSISKLFKSLKDVTLKECREECNKNSECHAFEWKESSDSKGYCEMNQGMAAKVHTPGTTLYEKRNNGHVTILLVLLLFALTALAFMHFRCKRC